MSGPNTTNADRASTWDENKPIDALIGDGGAAVWVRRTEVAPRSAIRRGNGDPVDACMDFAALRIGLRGLEDAMAARLDLTREQFDRMVEDAREVMAPILESATRVMPAGGGA